MGTGYVFAAVNTSASGQSLLVQTDRLGPITVRSGASGYIDNAAVSSNSDGSFDVFSSEFTYDSSTNIYTCADYEQAYFADGSPSGDRIALAHGESQIEPAWDAVGTVVNFNVDAPDGLSAGQQAAATAT